FNIGWARRGSLIARGWLLRSRPRRGRHGSGLVRPINENPTETAGKNTRRRVVDTQGSGISSHYGHAVEIVAEAWFHKSGRLGVEGLSGGGKILVDDGGSLGGLRG